MKKFSDSTLTRRQFIKGTTAVALTQALPLWQPSSSFGAGEPDLVVAEQGEPAALLQAAMAPLGGMGRFVKKGQRVVIKANIAWARTPEQASTNNPKLMAALIKMCYRAGAKRVAVWDHTCDNYQFCFARSGLKKVAQDSGADIFSGHGHNVYRKIDIPKAKKLKTAEVIKDVLDSDVFINFPIPKQHFATELTLSMKNLLGIVWDMELLHKIDLHQCIADLGLIRKPDLIVVDAIRILTTNGPKGPGKTEDPLQVMAATDMVSVDAYACSLFKNPKTGKPFKPAEIRFIREASALGLGQIDLSKVRLQKVKA